jgi:hypothetical protein
MPEDRDNEEMVLKESSPVYLTEAGEIDLSLLKDSLAKTPWERMQANDDALNFAESLRTAMEKRNAKFK